MFVHHICWEVRVWGAGCAAVALGRAMGILVVGAGALRCRWLVHSGWPVTFGSFFLPLRQNYLGALFRALMREAMMDIAVAAAMMRMSPSPQHVQVPRRATSCCCSTLCRSCEQPVMRNQSKQGTHRVMGGWQGAPQEVQRHCCHQPVTGQPFLGPPAWLKGSQSLDSLSWHLMGCATQPELAHPCWPAKGVCNRAPRLAALAGHVASMAALASLGGSCNRAAIAVPPQLCPQCPEPSEGRSGAPGAMDEEREAPLVGFLFGNVDENQRVDADYLDEVIQRRAGRAGLGRSSGSLWRPPTDP